MGDINQARDRAAKNVPFDREPVGTYGQALGWLFRFSEVQEWAFGDAPLPPEALLLCDVFWVDHQALRRDVRLMWDRALQPQKRDVLRDWMV